ncbi:MAG: hypothetical protein K2Y37_23585 [Pirellulales bacterium]|nr:hypothetical protein [Pirellulales bacterium]
MKRSRLALSLVLGILAALATVDRWPIGGQGVAADLPITLADRLCPADFADDRVCTESFRWFGDSSCPRRSVEHTARANAVTPWRPIAPHDRAVTQEVDLPLGGATGHDKAPISDAESGGFTCGFELEYVLQLARWIIGGEPTWAAAGAPHPASRVSVNLEAWLCPHEGPAAALAADRNGDDTTPRAVAGPVAPPVLFVPAGDLFFESLSPAFIYGAPRDAAQTACETAVIDQAAMAAAGMHAESANVDGARLVASDVQMICPAAAARYSWGPRSCDPVIAAELGLAPRSTLEWWGAAGTHDHLASRQAKVAADDEQCASDYAEQSSTAPLVGDLAGLLADLRGRRDIDPGLELNARLSEDRNSVAPNESVSVSRAGDDCGFAGPSAAWSQAPDAYLGIAEFLMASLLPEESVTTYPGNQLDSHAVLSGVIESAANLWGVDDAAAQAADERDFPSQVGESALFETVVAGPNRFVYLRKLAPSRWSTMLDWRAESTRAWEVSRRRWPLGSLPWVSPTTAEPRPDFQLYFRQLPSGDATTTYGAPANAANWPCPNSIADSTERDVAINLQALERAKALEHNAIVLATQCAECLRALAASLDSLASGASRQPIEPNGGTTDHSAAVGELRSAMLPSPPARGADEPAASRAASPEQPEYGAYLGL